MGYWKKQLSGQLAGAAAAERPSPAGRFRPHRGASERFTLPRSLSDAINALSRSEGVTLFMTLLAAFKTLLYRYTGQEDIIVGSPIANRNRVETEGLIGFFVNTLVLRTDLSGDPGFRELLSRVRQVTLDGYDHQDLPFEKLVEELQPVRDMSYSPLFQVAFALQNIELPSLELPGLTLSPVPIDPGTSKFDLTLFMWEEPEGLACLFEYSTDLFDAATIARMAGHFETLLESITAEPAGRISQLTLLTEAERRQLLVEWNHTGRWIPAGKCLHELFEEQVRRSPSAICGGFRRPTDHLRRTQPAREPSGSSFDRTRRRTRQASRHLRRALGGNGLGDSGHPESRRSVCAPGSCLSYHASDLHAERLGHRSPDHARAVGGSISGSGSTYFPVGCGRRQAGRIGRPTDPARRTTLTTWRT